MKKVSCGGRKGGRKRDRTSTEPQKKSKRVIQEVEEEHPSSPLDSWAHSPQEFALGGMNWLLLCTLPVTIAEHVGPNKD